MLQPAEFQLPQGMNLSNKTYMVDLLVDNPGQVRQRGPIQIAVTFPTLTAEPVLITATKNPAGLLRFLIIQIDGVVRICDATGAQITSHAAGIAMSSTMAATRLSWDAKPNLAGGVFISHMDYGTTRKFSRAEWRGGVTVDNGPGGAGKRVTNMPDAVNDIVTFVGTALTTDAIGCFLWAGGSVTTMVPLGWIYDVPSTTTVRISKPLYRSDGVAALTNAYVISPLHLHAPPFIGQGTISSLTTSAVVTGANTKFSQAELVGAGFTLVCREATSQSIGSMASVQGDTALTLGANAGAAFNNELYYIVRYELVETGIWDYLVNGLTVNTAFDFVRAVPGCWTTTYAGRQWDAARVNMTNLRQDLNTIWYSDNGRMLITDRVPGSGSFVVVGDAGSMSDEILNIAGTADGLIIWKRNSTWIINAKNPPFRATLLAADGILNPNSYAYWKGGLVWGGFQGIYYFDGQTVENIVEQSMGQEYKRIIGNLTRNVANYTTSSAWPQLMVQGDHVFVNLKAVNTNSGIYIRRP